jgi:hypothetical protein
MFLSWQSMAEGSFALFTGGFLVLMGPPPIGPGYGQARGRVVGKTYVTGLNLDASPDLAKFLIEFDVDGKTYTSEYQASSWGDRYISGDYADIKYMKSDKSKIYMPDAIPSRLFLFALMLILCAMAYRDALSS